MRLNKLMKSVAVAAIAVAALATVGEAEARTKMKIHSAFGRNIFVIGPGPYNVSKAVKAMSDGEVDMHIFEPGALVPGTAYYDPVSSGSIDGAWGGGTLFNTVWMIQEGTVTSLEHDTMGSCPP